MPAQVSAAPRTRHVPLVLPCVEETAQGRAAHRAQRRAGAAEEEAARIAQGRHGQHRLHGVPAARRRGLAGAVRRLRRRVAYLLHDAEARRGPQRRLVLPSLPGCCGHPPRWAGCAAAAAEGARAVELLARRPVRLPLHGRGLALWHRHGLRLQHELGRRARHPKHQWPQHSRWRRRQHCRAADSHR